MATQAERTAATKATLRKAALSIAAAEGIKNVTHRNVSRTAKVSMGTASYVVVGKGNVPSFKSSPHGAGRVYGRNQARKTFTIEDLDKAMVGIEYKRSAAFLDEIPGAYKDIDVVMDDAKDLVEIRHTLRQIVNVKGN